MKALLPCVFLKVPVEYYFCMKDNVFDKVWKEISIQNFTLKHLIEKMFIPKTLFKNNLITFNEEIAIISEGIFKIEKMVSVCKIKKTNLHLKKKFDIGLI